MRTFVFIQHEEERDISKANLDQISKNWNYKKTLTRFKKIFTKICIEMAEIFKNYNLQNEIITE